MGLSVRGAVVTIYGAGVVLGGSALLMSQLGSSARIVGVVGLLVAAGAVAVPLARVPVYGGRRRLGFSGSHVDESPAAKGTEAKKPVSDDTSTAMNDVAQPGGTVPLTQPNVGPFAQPARRSSGRNSFGT
jgi:hypothetical protein